MSQIPAPIAKPKELLELEKIYGVKFEVMYDEFHPGLNCAAIDSKTRKVIALGIMAESDLEVLSSLTELRILYLFSHPKGSLSPLLNLPSLEDLRLYGLNGTPICIPEELNLVGLSLHFNKDVPFSHPITGLNKLTRLTISSATMPDLAFLIRFNGLKELFLIDCVVKEWSHLNQLKELRDLSIISSSLTDTNFLRDLKVPLSSLMLMKNSIIDISALSGLNSLKYLHLAGNQIQDLSHISGMMELIYLDLSSNEVEDLAPIKDLKGLRGLDIGMNQVKDLTPVAGLKSLELFDFAANQITHIPETLFEREFDLNWHGNPIVEPDPAVLEQGRDAVLEWFAAQRKGTVPLNELRVMLIGHGEAGKTSLMRRLTTDSFDDKEQSTHGINMVKWLVQQDGRTIRVNLWDFGGQQMQHSVHKFFLSHACLYILVSDNRKEDDPQYWLEHIHTLAKDAPVLVVYNKADQNPEEVFSQKALKDRYPNIIGFFKVSCMTGAGINELREQLMKRILATEDASREYPKSYFNVKQKLEQAMNRGRHHIDIKVYRTMCKEAGVTDPKAQRSLLHLLNAIGTISFFDDTDLKRLQVLNPEWVCDGVYRIITHDRVGKRRGDITMHDLASLLRPEKPTDYTYDNSHHQYLLALMKKFELCHVREDGHILIPARFSTEPKADYADYRGADARLYFFFYKSFLPVSIIHRFIARHIVYALREDYWYRGIVLKDPESATEAFVELNEKEKRISLWIKGADIVGYWGYLRRQITELSDFFAGIEYDQYVAIDPENRGTRWVKYSNLINAVKNGYFKYYDATLEKEIDVIKFLGHFGESPAVVGSGLEAIRQLEASFGNLKKLPFIINAPQFYQSQTQSQQVQVTMVQQLSDDIIGKLHALLAQEQSDVARNRLEQVIKATEELEQERDLRNARRSGLLDRYTGFLNQLKNGGDWVNSISDAYHNLPELANNMAELIKAFAS